METMFRMKTIAIIVTTVLIMAGCAAKKKKATYGGGPDKLYAKGLARFNGEKHQSALEIFKDVKNYYPESPEAVRAEIRTADCHFFLAEYEEAIAIYEEFRKLHPYHEDIPYVLFQIGQAHFKQMRTPDRDQTPVREALSNFQYLVENYPSSIFTTMAAEKIPLCRLSLAEHEFLVGTFYYKRERFQGAASRFEAFLQEYADVELAPKALFYLGMSYLNLFLHDKADEVFLNLARDYPDSEYASRAEQRLGID
jgi:outer membrane protein assembly factor BamD